MEKKPRGRPRKNPIIVNEVKAKRGRPKKVIADIKPKTKVVLDPLNPPKPRGRPRKDVVSIIAANEAIPATTEKTKFFQSPQAVFAKKDHILNTPSLNFKSSKLLGYCPNCNMFIMESDKRDNKFECAKCGISDVLSKLNVESKIKIERPRTKKEYLDNCISLSEDHVESYVSKTPEIEIEKIIDPKIIEKSEEDELPSDNKE